MSPLRRGDLSARLFSELLYGIAFLEEFLMTADGICKFCQKSVTIPDNLQGSLLRCPFCLRDFDVFEPQNPAQNIGNSLVQRQLQNLLDTTQAATEFLRIRAAKKFAANFGCIMALLMAATLGGLLFSESWSYFLLTSLTAGMLLCGAWIILINKYFARSIQNAFATLFKEAQIAAPGSRELYMKLLADFSSRLKISEKKVISDPFLRSILNRLSDGLE